MIVEEEDDEIIFKVEIDEEQTVYVITVSRPSEGAISTSDFITGVEMWLHEITRAEIDRSKPGTELH